MLWETKKQRAKRDTEQLVGFQNEEIQKTQVITK